MLRREVSMLTSVGLDPGTLSTRRGHFAILGSSESACGNALNVSALSASRGQVFEVLCRVAGRLLGSDLADPRLIRLSLELFLRGVSVTEEALASLGGNLRVHVSIRLSVLIDTLLILGGHALGVAELASAAGYQRRTEVLDGLPGRHLLAIRTLTSRLGLIVNGLRVVLGGGNARGLGGGELGR